MKYRFRHIVPPITLLKPDITEEVIFRDTAHQLIDKLPIAVVKKLFELEMEESMLGLVVYGGFKIKLDDL